MQYYLINESVFLHFRQTVIKRSKNAIDIFTSSLWGLNNKEVGSHTGVPRKRII